MGKGGQIKRDGESCAILRIGVTKFQNRQVINIMASRGEVTIMKILLLGESNVGKTSLVTRYSQDKFDAQSNLLTVGIDIRKLETRVKGKKVLLELWDTAGQEKYKTLPSQYFRGIQAIILVYDLTDMETFIRIQDWLQKVEENSNIQQLCVSLVGNKLDLDEHREVNHEEAHKFAIRHNMLFKQTSAKEAINVSDMVKELAESVFQKGIKCATKTVRLEDTESKRAGETSCCG